jgi:hypothetical protein
MVSNTDTSLQQLDTQLQDIITPKNVATPGVSTPEVPETTKSDSSLLQLDKSLSSLYVHPYNSLRDDVSGGLPPINISNADMLSKNDRGQYNGFCQRFVEQATYGTTGHFASAAQAWNTIQNKVVGLDGIKPGDLVYFTPDKSNNNDGHVGIYEGNGMFKSATGTGIKDISLQDWSQQTGQSPMGYIPV